MALETLERRSHCGTERMRSLPRLTQTLPREQIENLPSRREADRGMSVRQRHGDDCIIIEVELEMTDQVAGSRNQRTVPLHLSLHSGERCTPSSYLLVSERVRHSEVEDPAPFRLEQEVLPVIRLAPEVL